MSEDRMYTDDMGEISGFGGGYEAACRAMVLAGLAWLDAHPNADPQFKGFLAARSVYGLISEENEDAKALTVAVVAASGGDCTGAMHHASIRHVLFAHKYGWAQYAEEMQVGQKGTP